jgi:hypothetical protein
VATVAPTISFKGSGTLTLSSADLDSTLTFSPVITGLDATDKIDFAGALTSAFWNAGILTLENGTTPVAYLHLSGNYASSTFTVSQANGISQIVDPPAVVDTIANGASLELSAPSADKIVFAGSTGMLLLDQPESYDGQITGFSANDVLTLKGFDAGHTTADAVYNLQNDTTVLTVNNISDHDSVSLVLDGNYSSTTFNVTAHQNGGIDITGSPATAATVAGGGTLELNHASSETITFQGGTGSLLLDQPQSFTGEIAGFTATAPEATHSDTIDLVGINYESAGFAETYNSSAGVLALTDGVHGASFKFEGFNGALNFASDGHGGTLITDPPPQAKPGEGPVGGNSEQFVFKAFAANAGPERMDDFRPGQSKIGSDDLGFESNGSGIFNPPLSGHATFEKGVPIDREPDNPQPHEGMEFLKNVALTSLHANDFVLPNH